MPSAETHGSNSDDESFIKNLSNKGLRGRRGLGRPTPVAQASGEETAIRNYEWVGILMSRPIAVVIIRIVKPILRAEKWTEDREGHR